LVWDAHSGEKLLTLQGHSHWVRSVSWSPDGKRLATGSSDKTALVWDAHSGDKRLTLQGHSISPTTGLSIHRYRSRGLLGPGTQSPSCPRIGRMAHLRTSSPSSDEPPTVRGY
jgi:WD40 repeat protein